MPKIGGIEFLMTGLAGALSNKNLEVIVFADGKNRRIDQEFDKKSNFKTLRFYGWKPLRRKSKALAIKNYVKNNNIKGIYTDSWKSVELLETGLHKKIPIISLAHGTELQKEQFNISKINRIKKSLSKVDCVAANSFYTADRVKDLEIDPEKIKVVYPGVEAAVHPERATEEIVKKKIGPGNPCLLTLARLEPRKGQDYIIKILPSLLKDYPNIIYILAGDGPYRKHLYELAKKYNVTYNVRFLGWITDPEKQSLLNQSDLFVMPSRIVDASVEGFGISYIDAAFHGLPTIAGVSGGATDAVIDDETGYCVDGSSLTEIEKCIRSCLENPEKLKKLGTNAKERAYRDFPWHIAVNRYLNCLP
mgnify:FL=1